MGDGGKTISVPKDDGLKTVTVKANIPDGCYPTGVTYACNKQQPVKQMPAQNTNVGGNQDCKPCSSWSTRLGHFLGRVGRGIWNCTAGLFKGAGTLLCGAATGVGGILGGIGKVLGNIGCAFNNAVPSVACYPTTQFVCQRPRVQSTFVNTPIAYPFSSYGSCYSSLSYNNSGFTTGLLFGALMNKGHNHCHGHVSRPIIINRHFGYGRPFGGRHWGCC